MIAQKVIYRHPELVSGPFNGAFGDEGAETSSA
ncbi:MAG: hypothetical protein JWN78_1944 [Bacteroidota bacterium]|nr:hypothetical protein [Bacteroidota bacterium]